MKRFLALLLAVLMMTGCLFAVACKKPEDPETPSNPEEPAPEAPKPRAFIAGYERLESKDGVAVSHSYRILLNLNADGTMTTYVAHLSGDEHETAIYNGTYSFGANEENDETITFTYTHATAADPVTETISDAVIIDGMFAVPFYLLDTQEYSAADVKFYETDPITLEGDTYLGYLTKSSGMGNMVYAYLITLKADKTFVISIMQLAGATMHIVGTAEGTYSTDGANAIFTYDVPDGEGGIAKEDHAVTVTDFSATTFSAGFNIAQAGVLASPAPFIKLK